MHDPVAVGVGERATDLGADLGDVAIADAARCGVLAEIRPGDEFADQVGDAVLAAELVEGDDPRVVEARSGVRLTQHAARRVALDGLDGDVAAEPLVPGAVNGAVAATAEPLTDRETPQNPLAFDHVPSFATMGGAPAPERPQDGSARGAARSRRVQG